mmetsp:Transcript_16048/g.34704  ORF Transcript_16048/g.34704 Transcript_16048/m.34704 type:complete len:235 (+) Transcript_16048:262-966(+)|eukprot:CAMPEP_0202902286 /NCGR_PEP_ID=MMETSP1392-20130828/16766_1 /ASSEMBLY_ACC=CAM_ASM_000868 /TAXON_ID=225041 /ORGANISM="Chlamydomonas chlamydogama, Strain SAG 11-48b" /LENGTH=234 /DNA_ID=CAMNT_0049589029 /DNA_START=262 /DNA_END=966 /DNA_ORIENTATION=-
MAKGKAKHRHANRRHINSTQRHGKSPGNTPRTTTTIGPKDLLRSLKVEADAVQRIHTNIRLQLQRLEAEENVIKVMISRERRTLRSIQQDPLPPPVRLAHHCNVDREEDEEEYGRPAYKPQDLVEQRPGSAGHGLIGSMEHTQEAGLIMAHDGAPATSIPGVETRDALGMISPDTGALICTGGADPDLDYGPGGADDPDWAHDAVLPGHVHAGAIEVEEGEEEAPPEGVWLVPH